MLLLLNGIYYLTISPNKNRGNLMLYLISPLQSLNSVRIFPIVFLPENVKWAFPIIAFSQISRAFFIEEI